jgi:glutamate synthase (NADPH/NADH) small chain
MARIPPKKTEMRAQPAERRIHNFEEVPYGYSEREAIQEAERCIACKKPRCISGCPVEIDIPGFISQVARGNFKEASRVLRDKNVLPAVCGRVCPQEEQCEKECILGRKMEPVAIGRLERFVADWAMANLPLRVPKKPRPTGKRIAVVGSGPAGLTVAGDLLKSGHAVTIFEALHLPGGVLTYGIPEFRLPTSIIMREVESLKRLGAELFTDYVVGMTRTVDELFDEFDAVFLGTGAGLPWFMDIPGEELKGVYSANEYLTRVNLMKAYLFPEYKTPVIRGRSVATIGGGNVAMDAARTALRLGAERSYIIYRRSKAEMPARNEEIEHAEEEGIIFKFLTLPIRYIPDEDGHVRAAECLRMKLGEPDDSGRRRPVPIEGSEFQIPIDVVVCAIGNSPNPLVPRTTPGLETTRWGTLVTDEETGRTTKKGVFAGGDIVTGAATVILAMGAGRIAARSIEDYLKTGTW